MFRVLSSAGLRLRKAAFALTVLFFGLEGVIAVEFLLIFVVVVILMMKARLGFSQLRVRCTVETDLPARRGPHCRNSVVIVFVQLAFLSPVEFVLAIGSFIALG